MSSASTTPAARSPRHLTREARVAGLSIELHRIDAEAERRQLQRTARVRSERNTDGAAQALGDVRRAAAGADNLLPPMREALRARCTIGEIGNVLRDEFGVYDARRA